MKVKALQDETGDWYIIPNELEDKFERWVQTEGEEWANLHFEQYATGGDLNNVQLYAVWDVDKSEYYESI